MHIKFHYQGKCQLNYKVMDGCSLWLHKHSNIISCETFEDIFYFALLVVASQQKKTVEKHHKLRSHKNKRKQKNNYTSAHEFTWFGKIACSTAIERFLSYSNEKPRVIIFQLSLLKHKLKLPHFDHFIRNIYSQYNDKYTLVTLK